LPSPGSNSRQIESCPGSAGIATKSGSRETRPGRSKVAAGSGVAVAIESSPPAASPASSPGWSIEVPRVSLYALLGATGFTWM